MVERTRLSVRTRFEVFKRDDFTCRYCGRKTPRVVLEIDHVIPVSKGGTDDQENLVTSCWECNRGKSDVSLDSIPADPDLHDRTVLMLEKELQLAEYNAVMERIREREEEDLDDLHSYWDELADGRARQFPDRTMLRKYLRLVSKSDVKDAMEIAAARKGDWVGCRYLGGILRNMVQGDHNNRDEADR